MAKGSIAKDFERKLSTIKENDIFSADYQKKKLITYTIRTVIVVILYFIFWEYQWVRRSLFFYVPVNLFSLFSIFGWNTLLNKKIERIKRKIEKLNLLK